MNPSEKALFRAFMLEMGLIPAGPEEPVHKILAKMDKDKARVLKRKFRKILRQANKASSKSSTYQRYQPASSRRYVVFNYIMRHKVRPAIEQVQKGKKD
jgi:hypothetical protein